jgi:MoxR-like ATPase
MTDWKLFRGTGEPHDDLARLPPPPPWRFGGRAEQLQRPSDLDLEAEAGRARPFIPSPGIVLAVNAALYLRRPLLLTGKPGTGKSTLTSNVAYELKLGPVLRWPITSRSTVRACVYDYDAFARLQASKIGELPVEDFLKLGPLGTALMATTWPRPLLIDEIDKSDLDFANDLLNVLEEGTYEIPELRRLNDPESHVNDYLGRKVTVREGKIQCIQFPFIVMTSNAEREFPPPFLRRCIRLYIEQPTLPELERILDSHFAKYEQMSTIPTREKRDQLIADFDRRRQAQDLATDQLLNAVFLTVTLNKSEERTFDEQELQQVRESLFRQISGSS